MRCILFALALLLPLAPEQSEAFVFKKVVYSSPVEGTIHWGGKPLPNVTITRELYSSGFKNDRYEDTAQTNGQGKFTLPVVEERRLFRPDLLSANPTVYQSMTLIFDGRRYAFWSHSKHNFFERSEGTGGVLIIDCDLSKHEDHDDFRIVRYKHNGSER